MKLDYATLISPYPLFLHSIGSIKSPTLFEIFDAKVTYSVYKMFLSLLSTDMQIFCEKINPQLSEWFGSLSDDEKSQLNIFDMIANEKALQDQYKLMLNFFVVENVEWNEDNHLFVVYNTTDTINIVEDESYEYTWLEKMLIKIKLIKKKTCEKNSVEESIVGIINKENWNELCDVILQRCGINRDNAEDELDESKIKNKRVLSILNKIKIGEQKMSKNNKYNKDMELSNIISKVAVKANSINFTNIWGLTVFQLYEQFKQECTNMYFDISKISVATWGNEKKSFKGNEWYRNDN